MRQTAASGKLPKFNDNAKCPKCGFNDDTVWPTVMYCDGQEENCGRTDNPKEEHLHQTCDLCGFEWLVEPLAPTPSPGGYE